MTGTLPLNVLIHWKGRTQDFLSAGANSANLHRDLPYTDRVSSQTLCQKKKLVFLGGSTVPPCPPLPLCTALTGILVRSSFTGLFFAIGMPVDAFFQSWEMTNCLVVPPVGIFSRVLSYISLQNVSVTLVVSVWPSATFWPLLWQRYATIINLWTFAIVNSNYSCCHGRAQGKLLICSIHWNGCLIFAVRTSFNPF